MYIKIENNILTQWADWEFDGSEFVDINYDEFNDNKDRYKVENNSLVDLKETKEYKALQRIKEIDAELQKLDELYFQESQTPVEYNGKFYKFEWTNLYQGILKSGILPAKIWDLSELEQNSVLMDEQQLQSLQNKLLQIQETAFQTRKVARSILLNEKSELENELKGE